MALSRYDHGKSVVFCQLKGDRFKLPVLADEAMWAYPESAVRQG